MSEEQVQESTLQILLKSFKPAGFFSSAGNVTKHQTRNSVNPRQILWAVRTLETGSVEIAPLVGGLPAPASMRMAKKIERSKFLEQYWPEPEQFVQDAMALFAANSELAGYPQNATDVIKRYLPLVLVYLATSQREKAETVIDFLVAHSVPMCEKQKKLLNRVAVELRRDGKPDAALDCYASIEKYYGEDEHLHFNIARTLWDMRKLKDCLTHLERSLRINPHMDVARQFRDKIIKMLAQKKSAAAQARPAVVVDNKFKVSS